MNAESQPWLSVIMPVYQGGAYLRAALDSVLAQPTPELEVIAVDDGSTDATPTILREYAGRLPLRIITRPHIGNWVSNTNVGLREARGRYAGFLHQDDVWHPRRLAVLRRLTEQFPEVGFFLHPALFMDENAQWLGRWSCPFPIIGKPLAPGPALERYAVQNFIPLPTPLFSLELARRVGPLDESLWFTADYDFWARLMRAGPLVYWNEPLAGFRLHAQSQTAVASHDPADMDRQYRTVSHRILNMPEFPAARRDAVRRVADFNTELNVALAQMWHGRKGVWAGLAWRGLSLGPAGWRRFLRESRFMLRVGARWRLGWRKRWGAAGRGSAAG